MDNRDLNRLGVPEMDFHGPNRHFSNASSTYSSQTNQSQQSQMSQRSHQSDQSQGSSVIVNKSTSDDLSKAHLQSNVLLYIKQNQSDFDPNDLFQQRQQRQYIGKSRPAHNYQPQRSHLPEGHEFGSRKHSDDENSINFNDNNEENGDEAEHGDDEGDGEGEHLFGQSMIGYREDHNDKASIFFDNEQDQDNNHSLEVDSDDDVLDDDDMEEDDDMLLPPSPPRSPPRELDPDKLYGLYDFSGPDPLHCSISRDEPVYLINDQDNYWWLIKKFSKSERIQLLRERHLNKSSDDELNLGAIDNNHDEFDEDNVVSDEEDGKIGFVPAECLETYGERLARLNCFKNEELEKSSRDLLETSNASSAENVVENNKSTSSIGLGSPANFQKSPDTTLSRSGSILKDSTKQLINKSVTFEDLGVLELNENSESENEEQNFPEYYYDIPGINNSSKQPESEKGSEILSDIYPSETPLIINKRKEGDTSLPLKQRSISPPIDHDSDLEGDVQDNSEEETKDSKQMLSPNESIEVSRASPNTDDAYENHISITTTSPTTPQIDFRTPEAQQSSTFQGAQGQNNPDSIDSNDPAFKTPLDPGSAFDEGSSTRNLTPRSERLRRAEILDKLNQVTFDIQNELDMDNYNPYYRQGSFLLSFEADRDSNSYLSSSRGLQINEELSDVDKEILEARETFEQDQTETTFSESQNRKDHSHNGLVHSVLNSVLDHNGTLDHNGVLNHNGSGLYSPDNHLLDRDIHTQVGSGFGEMNNTQESYDDDGYDSSQVPNSKDFNVTPLTSVNSLNGENTKTTLADKRKSKPVHDMFVPILGKFDELAEKLAEIDGML